MHLTGKPSGEMQLPLGPLDPTVLLTMVFAVRRAAEGAGMLAFCFFPVSFSVSESESLPLPLPLSLFVLLGSSSDSCLADVALKVDLALTLDFALCSGLESESEPEPDSSSSYRSGFFLCDQGEDGALVTRVPPGIVMGASCCIGFLIVCRVKSLGIAAIVLFAGTGTDDRVGF
jgi:hypothetical protein